VLKHRLPTGAALIALALVIGWLDERLEHSAHVRGLALALATAPVVALASMELASMLRACAMRMPRWLAPASAVAGLAIGAVSTLTPADYHVSTVSTPLIALWLGVTLLALAWPRRTEGVLLGASGAMLILVYLGLIPSSYLVVRQHETAWTVMVLILIAKSCDIGAYFTGMSIGKHKLIPWLSPGKTWEGLIGGMLTAGLVAMGFALIPKDSEVGAALLFPLSPAASVALGMVVGGVGQAGDLAVSLFKRDAGRKDASMTLPGFGGVLDVIDSLIFVGPAAHWLIMLLG